MVRPALLPTVAAVLALLGAFAAGPLHAAGTLDGVRAPETVCVWQSVPWRDLSAAEQRLWAALGWNDRNWNATSAEEYPSSEFQAWHELDENQRQALVRLGYTEFTWDHISEYCGDPA